MMLYFIISGFLLALLIPAIYKAARQHTGWISALLPASAFAWFLSKSGEVASGNSVLEVNNWVSSLGVSLSFYLDGLGLLFALLITGIGAIVLVYAGSYMKGKQKVDRFFIALILFMASMLGLVLSDNMITMFIFWELTSFSSYFLIGFHNQDDDSRKSALQALLITAGGGLALLAGIVLMYLGTGTMSIQEVLASREVLENSDVYFWAMFLVILGAFTKSAQFPFHFWLPSAMAAPTPVSAYLHSATMVKAGIYLLARLSPAFAETTAWHASLIIAGAVTMLLGAVIALLQSDLKKILAYTTVSALGLLTLLLGIGTELAIHAAVIFILAHALYKGCLFLMAGIVDKQTGTRNIHELGNLRHSMPVSAWTTVIACLSMAGVPPLFGFISKETTYEAAIYMGVNGPVATSAIFMASILFVAAACILSLKVFFSGSTMTAGKPVKEASAPLLAGPVLLAAACVVFGLGGFMVSPLLSQAAASVMPAAEPLQLYLWHGFNIVLLLSAITLISGYGLYLYIRSLGRTLTEMEVPEQIKPSYAYERYLEWFNRFSVLHTKIVQNGYLRIYISVIVITFIILALYVLRDIPVLPSISILWSDFYIYDLVVALIVLLACFYTVMATSRLLAIAMLGVVGYGISMIFIIYSAPDLAMTQFLVETLTVVLFVLVLHKLPRYLIFAEGFIALRYFIISLIFGGIMTWVVLIITGTELHSPLKEYYAANSWVLAKGQNVVNVILVDFRALDTMGEIIVLAIAAIGVYGILKLKPKSGKKKAA